MNRIKLSQAVMANLWKYYAEHRLNTEVSPRFKRPADGFAIGLLRHYQSLGWNLQYDMLEDLAYSISGDQAPFFLLTYGD